MAPLKEWFLVHRLKVAAAIVLLALLGAGAWYALRKPEPVVAVKPAKKGVRKTFKPSHKTLKFPFGTFSGFRVVGSGADMEPGVYGRLDGKSDKELLAIKFYLPEAWKGSKLNQQNVATALALSRPKDSNMDWSFQAPETGGSKRQQFFLALTSVDEKTGEGRLQVIIVGEMQKAVYSITYTRLFEAQQGKVRKTMEQWLVKNIEDYGPPLGLIDPDKKWLEAVRKKRK